MAALGTIRTSILFAYDKLRQGGSDGPFLWNTIVRYLTCLIRDRWAVPGTDIDGIMVSPIWWADSFGILSSNQ